jgi:hypothetical protein
LLLDALTMRLSVVGSLLLMAALGCDGGGGESPNDFGPSSDDEIVSSTNTLGMRLVFDDASSHVRATMKTKVLAGETLLMRIRRGRLVPGADATLDCTQLAEAPPLRAAAGASTSAKIVYDGPEIDRSLLVSVYSDDWITANIAPDVLEQLSRDGADSIVEACIVTLTPPVAIAPAPSPLPPAANAMRSPTMDVRLRLQTSLQDAWDSSDPHASASLRASNEAAASATR